MGDLALVLVLIGLGIAFTPVCRQSEMAVQRLWASLFTGLALAAGVVAAVMEVAS